MDLKSIIDTRRKGDPDLILFVTVFVLAGVGIAMSYSASAVFAQKAFGDSFYFLKKQLLWFVLGFLLLLAFQEVDYKFFARHTKLMLAGSFVLLVLVFVPGIGHSAKGSSRWIGIGPAMAQPSEFVKIVAVIYLSKVFSSETKGNHLIQLLIPVVIIAAMFILIMLQPDFGTAVDLLIVSVVIIFASGFPIFYILSLFIISIPMFYMLVYQVGYRRERIIAYLDPWKDRFGTGYHIIQSFIAFKIGGLVGVGLGAGTQKITRLPEPHNDFVLAVIAEEAGLLGTLFLLSLFVILLWRGIHIALTAADDFGRLLAVGITLMIVIQAFINLAVVTGSLPTKGIPLPFVSYGGSSLVSTMVACGLLLSVSRYRHTALDGIKISEGVF